MADVGGGAAPAPAAEIKLPAVGAHIDDGQLVQMRNRFAELAQSSAVLPPPPFDERDMPAFLPTVLWRMVRDYLDPWVKEHEFKLDNQSRRFEYTVEHDGQVLGAVWEFTVSEARLFTALAHTFLVHPDLLPYRPIVVTASRSVAQRRIELRSTSADIVVTLIAAATPRRHGCIAAVTIGHCIDRQRDVVRCDCAWGCGICSWHSARDLHWQTVRDVMDMHLKRYHDRLYHVDCPPGACVDDRARIELFRENE